ncbi:hypothetical protein [Streptacidiphilus sp. EB103A]|uniref:DUF7638 domain-containing protein n=1 Tax=Streptacidiphilus sp. EB103A TaxID=3156275 RepID=UPI0035192FFE
MHADTDGLPEMLRPNVRVAAHHPTFRHVDGLIDCWELIDLAEFEQKLHSGWVATSLEEGQGPRSAT